MTLQDLLNRTCLLGLSYFDTNQDLLKQVQHAGTVVNVDAEKGISIQLHANTETTIATDREDHIFVIPPLLSTWFKAPEGTYRDSAGQILIESPDYFVTWDVYKTQKEKQGDHEWWDWVPRTTPPKVN